MTIGHFFATAALCFLLCGCANVVRSDYAGNRTHQDIESAISNIAPIGKIDLGAARTMKISEDSPLIDTDAAKGRFEVIALSGQKGAPYKFTVVSICDCLGFRKWVVVPQVYLLDGSKNIVMRESVSGPTIRHLSGIFPKDGTYLLVVVADSTSEGRTVSEMSAGIALPGKPYIPNVIPLAMRSHPTGMVRIKWEEQ